MIFCLALAITTTTHAAATDDDLGADATVMPGVVVVQFEAGIDIPHGAAKAGVDSFDQLAEQHQVYAIEKAFPFLEAAASKRALTEKMEALRRIYVVHYSTPMRPRHVAAALAQDANVVFAEPQFIRRITEDVSASMETLLPTDPDDALYGNMTHLGHLRVPDAWDVVKGEDGDPRVVIAIVDGGTDWRHPDLMANIWTNPGEIDGNGIDDDGNGQIDDIHGWNFAADPDTNDPTGLPDKPSNAAHGTRVAGTAVAVTNNAVGVAGTSWNAEFMAVNAGCPNQDSLICFGFRGVLYAAMTGADIINASWGGDGASEAERQVIEAAVEAGALVVSSAGNEGANMDRQPFYPAAYGAVLSVGGTGKVSDTIFGNYGRTVNVFAPGQQINTTSPNGQYSTNVNGTSFSSPLVAGIAALVKTLNPGFTPHQVREQIRVTSDAIDGANFPQFNGLLGRGRVNAFRAVTETDNPAIRLTDLSFTTGSGSPDITSSETVTVAATFTNYLADASGVTLELGTDDSFITINTASATVGTLASGASTTVNFEFELANNTPNNRTLIFYTRVITSAFTDEPDVFRLPANQTAVAGHSTGRPGQAPALQVSITNEGNIGYLGFQGQSSGLGFRTNGRDVLFEGGLIVATGPNTVSDCVRGTDQSMDQNTDFVLKDGATLEIIKPGILTSEEGRVEIVDTQADTPIGLSILQESFVDTAPGNEDFLILRYLISNTTQSTITNLYAGLFFDWDVDAVNPLEDVLGFDEDRQFGYVRDASVFVGTRLLTTNAALSYYAIDNPADIYRDETGQGFTEREKWDWLSGGVQRKTLPPTDASQLTGAGPFSIDPGSAVEVAFAIVAGRGLADLQLNADNALTLWETTLSMPVSIDDPAPGPGGFFLRPVYPHPTLLPARFEFEVGAPSDVTLTIYDVLGRKVQTLVDGRKGAGAHTIVWDGADDAGRRVASGLYLARWTARSGSTTVAQSRQVVVVR